MSKKLIAGLGVVAGLAVAMAPVATFALKDATYNSDNHTDVFRVTVLPTCSFGTTKTATAIAGVAHNTDGSGNSYTDNYKATWTLTGTLAADSDHGLAAVTLVDDNKKGTNPDRVESVATSADNYSIHGATYSIYAGETKDDFATTSLTVVCNNADGYKIYAYGTDLEETISEQKYTIPFADTYSTSVSGYGIVSGNKDSGATTAKIADTATKGDNQAITVGKTEETRTVLAENSAESDENGDKFTFTYGIGVKSAQKTGTYEGRVTYNLVQQVTK